MKKPPTKKKELLRKIKSEFPKLSFSKPVFIEYGDDHAVVILDKKIVFRFPRNGLYRKSFSGELKLLSALKNKTSLSVPDYIYISKKKDFGGYKLIKGKELSEKRFARLSSVKKKTFTSDIAKFLKVLHGLDKNILPANRAHEPWSMDNLTQYKTRYWKERRKLIASFADQKTLKQIDAFYETFISLCSKCPKRTVIQGDLSGDHMLLNTKNKQLNGIIDFGDAAIGDPAHDFSFFWSYGDKIPKAIYKKYGPTKDKKLLERSEWYYMRFTIDRLYFCIHNKKKRKAACVENVLQERLPILLASVETQ